MKRFLVVSRMHHLEIVEKSGNKDIGLMCEVGDISQPFRDRLRWMKYPKICDSGIFAAERVTYEELFDRYAYVRATWGIILDKYRDMEGTLESAIEAQVIYRKGKRRGKNWNFSLVGVCQGASRSIKEYLECLTELRDMGYQHIAIGGLLYMCGGRYKVESPEFLGELLFRVREIYHGWLFVLGAYSEARMHLFEKWGVTGADSKQWCFKYKRGQGNRQEQLLEYVTNLCKPTEVQINQITFDWSQDE